MTRQRLLILEAVSKVGSHPTADEVYARVKRRLPHISLGTVYRNLDTLAERGMIGKLEQGGSQKRYDGSTDGHHHIRCLKCGMVVDAPVGGFVKLETKFNDPSGYAITGFRLELLGYCPRCKKRGVPGGSAGSDRR